MLPRVEVALYETSSLCGKMLRKLSSFLKRFRVASLDSLSMVLMFIILERGLYGITKAVVVFVSCEGAFSSSVVEELPF